MKKGIIFILLIIFLVFFSTRETFAVSSFGKFFGGKIVHPKSIQINTLEGVGYVCTVPGSTITIRPIGSPTLTPSEYFIPSYVRSKTGTTPITGQSILGRYGGKSMITCILPEKPPLVLVQTVTLDTINLYGTSQF